MKNIILAVAALAFLWSCKSSKPDAVVAPGGEITIYSGRSKKLVADLMVAYEKKTGTKVNVRYGSTVAMGGAILEEGDNSPADVFLSQDAGALGVLSAAGKLQPLATEVTSKVDPKFVSPKNDWVGVSGRGRVLAYSTDRIKPQDLPSSVMELTDPKWEGRVGWPPGNASFQSFVTALRVSHGQDKAKAWLTAMRENGAKEYPKNTPIVQAIAAGEIDVGLVNHYYLYRFLKEHGDAFPVRNHHFPGGDVGSLVNVAGVAILKSAPHATEAKSFVDFLLGEEAQAYFAEKTFEYPLAKGARENTQMKASLKDIQHPTLDLNSLSDLQASLALLRETGVLK